jgi:ribose 5-phosphate isomerase B
MKIAVASDHAGYVQKEVLKKYLEGQGHKIVDCGAMSEERSDYPDFGHKLARLVSDKGVERGVMVCGSGIGMCMVANRHKGVRAAVLHDENDAILSREHNDANVACFGSRVTSIETIKSLTDIFLKAPFAGGRHAARVEKIDSK